MSFLQLWPIYVGAAGGKITLYRKKTIVKTGIPQENGVDELINLLKADGRWQEPPIGTVIASLKAPYENLEPLKVVVGS